MNLKSREVRKYVYTLFVALGPVLVLLGVADAEFIAVSLPALLALLNLTPADIEQPDGDLDA